MYLTIASADVVSIAAVATAIGTMAGAAVAVWKIGPDNKTVRITEAQGASTLLNDLAQTLQGEVARLQHELETEQRLRREKEAECVRYLREIAQLNMDIRTLGTRKTDRDPE